MSDFRLKVFQSVAKNLSFTKASQELFVSQPAITKHIQELETCYQTRLFERQGSKISLTEAGELLLKHSEKILDDYKQLEYEMHLLHDEYIGELKLGASTTIAPYILTIYPYPATIIRTDGNQHGSSLIKIKFRISIISRMSGSDRNRIMH